MSMRILSSVKKSCRFLLPPLLILSGCGEGLPEGELLEDTLGQQGQEAVTDGYEDLSCTGVTVGGWTRDANGWTVLPDPLAIGGRKIFVSNPVSGTTNSAQGIYYVDTLAEGLALLRKGSPDAMYLKRGQTFTGDIPGGKLGGASISKPMVVGAFGTGARPVLRGSINFGAASSSHVAFVSLDLQGDGTDYGIWWGKSHTAGQPPVNRNILIEDVRVQRFDTGIALVSSQDVYTPAIAFENITLRRSQVVDNWGHDRSQGIYAEGIQGLTIEESLFDHNGFQERNHTNWELRASTQAHNMYLHAGNKCVKVKGSVSANAASHGLQMRGGGEVHDNFFVRNPLGVSYGLVNGEAVNPYKLIRPGVSGSIVGNTLWESTDINTLVDANGNQPGLRHGGIEVGNALRLLIQDNLMAHHTRGSVAGTGLIFTARMGIGVHNLKVAGNTVHNTARALEFGGNGWGPATVRTDGSVANAQGTTLITADASGLKPRSSPLAIQDTGSLFQGNRFSRVTGDIVTVWGTSNFLGFTDYASNTYDCASGVTGCTSYGSLNDWLSRNGETGYKTGAISFVHASRSLGNYLQQTFPGTALLDKEAAYQNYISRVRAMNRNNWDARLMGQAVSSYLRAGFVVQP